MTTSPQVLVVGAGPAGLMTARELARCGVNVMVIDERAHRGLRSKATTVWSRQLELFDRQGIAEAVIDHGARIDRVTVSTPRRGLAAFELSELRGTRFPFGISIPQPRLEQLLEDSLRELGVPVRKETRLIGLELGSADAHATIASSAGLQQESYSFVVGADGATSTVRTLARLPFQQTGSALTFAITDVRLNGPFPRHDVGYYYAADGALGLVPMGEDVFRIALGVPANSPMLERHGFAKALQDRTGRAAELADLPWESHFEVKFQHADRYSAGRVALVGDAAHTMSPAGGQGMNTGLKDATLLAEYLSRVIGCDLDGVERALADYSTERRRDVLRVMQTSRLLTRFGADSTLKSRAQREALAAATRHLGPVRRAISRRISQLDESLGASRIPRYRAPHQVPTVPAT